MFSNFFSLFKRKKSNTIKSIGSRKVVVKIDPYRHNFNSDTSIYDRTPYCSECYVIIDKNEDYPFNCLFYPCPYGLGKTTKSYCCDCLSIWKDQNKNSCQPYIDLGLDVPCTEEQYSIGGVMTRIAWESIYPSMKPGQKFPY